MWWSNPPIHFKTVFYGVGRALNPNNNFVQAFCEDQDQNIWIGTGGGGLRYWNRRNNSYTLFTHDPAKKNTVGSNFITGILRMLKTDIWVSSYYGGISRFNKLTQSFDHYPCFNPYTNSEETKGMVSL
jgi:hypothetical protein